MFYTDIQSGRDLNFLLCNREFAIYIGYLKYKNHRTKVAGEHRESSETQQKWIRFTYG